MQFPESDEASVLSSASAGSHNRSRQEKTSQVQELGDCDNLIPVFMRSLTMKRWRSPIADEGINDHFGGNELASGTIFEDTDLLAWNQSVA